MSMNLLSILTTFLYTFFAWCMTTATSIEAVDDTTTLNSADTVTIQVLANDINVPSDTVFLQIMSPASHGSLMIDSLNQVVYIHDGSAATSDTFSYIVCTLDSITTCDMASVFLTIQSGSIDTTYDLVLSDSSMTLCPYINSSIFLENLITFTSDSNLTFSILDHGTYATTNLLTMSADQHLLTMHPLNVQGMDTISIQICNTVMCDTVFLYLDFVSTAMDTIVLNVADTTENINLPYNNDQYYNVNILDENINANTTTGYDTLADHFVLHYTPNAGITTDTLEVMPLQSVITVGAINRCDAGILYVFHIATDTPVVLNANDDYISIQVDSIPLLDVTSNDSLPEGSYHISLLDSTSFGNLFITSQNYVVYQPSLGFEGMDSFQYLICMDSLAGICDSAWVTIQVGEIDTTVVDTVKIHCADDHVYIAIDSIININVLSNDSFFYTTHVSINMLTSPTHGSTLITSLQNIIYIPDSSFTGVDSFEYIACYDTTPAMCDTAWAYIYVGENMYPTCPENLVVEGCPLSNLNIDLDDYFSDIDDSILTYTFLGDSSNLSWNYVDSTHVLFLQNQFFTFNPTTLEVIGCDSYNQCDTMTIHLIPTTTIDTFHLNILDSDTLAIGASSVESIIIDSCNHGALFQDSLAINLYYNSNGYIGQDTIVIYQYDSLTSSCHLAIYEIEISPIVPNDSLFLQDDNIVLNQNATIQISPLSNDIYSSWDTLYILTNPSHGVANLEDTIIQYTPTLNYSGMDSIQYILCSTTSCDTAWIYLEIISIQPPVAETDQVSTYINTEATINVLSNDYTANTAHVTSFTQGEHGTTTLNTDGTITYTPDLGYVGLDVFSYMMCDDINQLCDTTLVLVNVVEVTPDIVVVSNVITPNGDGYNDNLMISNLQYYTSNQLNIYNRWGVLVYQKDNYQSDWNSTWENKNLPNGTYYYVLYLDRYKISDANTKSGFILIMK